MHIGKNFFIRLINLMIFCGFTFLCLNGCRNQSDNPYLPYEKILDAEPNNKFETAQILKISANLNIAGFYNESENKQSFDSDYYHILLGDSDRAYKMTLTAVPGVDGKLVVYSPNHELLFEMNERSTGEAEVVWDYYCRYSDIYVAVISNDGANVNVPYMLSIATDNQDSRIEIEPNNEEKNATVLTALFPLKAYIVPNDDVDCYRLEFDSPSCDFRVKVESFSNLDVSLTLVENISAPVSDTTTDIEYIRKSYIVNQNGWGGSEMTQYFSSGKGDFYAYVTAEVQGSLKEPVYYITLETFSEGAYEREFNNSKEEATPILTQEEIIGELDPADSDYFYFDILASGTRAELSLDGMSDKRFTVEVEHSDGTSVYNGKGITNLSLRDLKSGRYYLILKQAENVGVKNRYRLFINTYSSN